MPAPNRTITTSIVNRIRLNSSVLANLSTTATAAVAPRSRKYLARFVIQTKGAAKISDVTRAIQKALGGTGSTPVTGMSQGRFPLPPGTRQPLASAFDLRPLFPGADPNDRRFKLADFLVLTLPVTSVELKRQLSGRNSALFELSYQLKSAGNFVRVDPEIANKDWKVEYNSLQPASPPAGPITGPAIRPLLYSNPFNQVPSDHVWNLRKINLPLTNNGGTGIVVGQVDTGTHPHPELSSVYISDISRHFSVIDGSNVATDPLTGMNPGHGVSTASVLASRGAFTSQEVTTGVTGVATDCKILPVRGVSSVANISNIDVAEGIWHCVMQNVDVITLSIGGYLNAFLERVVSFAVFRNIIVVAAAGQVWPMVVAPACYRDCIAVTATDPDDHHMLGASSGPEIDIAAPGEDVYCASIDDNGPRYYIESASGTSFATPTVAAAAALWLAQHGRQNLLAQYGNRRKLAEVFRQLIQATARQPHGWNAERQGAGILDVTALLAAALPPEAAVTGRDWSQYEPTTEFELLRQQLGNPNENYLLSILAKWFNTTVNNVANRLEDYGTEILAVIVKAPEVLEDLSDAVEQEAQNAAEAVTDALDDAVDAVGDFISDVAGTVLGWFG